MKSTQIKLNSKKYKRKKHLKSTMNCLNILLNILKQYSRTILKNLMIKNKLNKQVKMIIVNITISWIKIIFLNLSEIKLIIIKMLLKSIFNLQENKKKKGLKHLKCIFSFFNFLKITIFVSSRIMLILSRNLRNQLLFILEIYSSIMQNKLNKWVQNKLKASFISTRKKYLTFLPFGSRNNHLILFLFYMLELLKDLRKSLKFWQIIQISRWKYIHLGCLNKK